MSARKLDGFHDFSLYQYTLALYELICITLQVKGKILTGCWINYWTKWCALKDYLRGVHVILGVLMIDKLQADSLLMIFQNIHKWNNLKLSHVADEKYGA